MIRIIGLNKYYNRRRRNEIHVIDNTNLELPDKGLVALLGPSGCGKTTLLNAIGGLDRVNKGNIYINNKKITSKWCYKVDKIRNLNIGYIFQDYKLIDDMTVYENVSIVLQMIGIKDKNEIKKRVEYILDRVGMYRYRYRPCGMLSGGERQRVGIARALVKNPDIVLADEPTGNLDSKNTIEIMNIIKAISKDKLVILVTHEVDIAKFYADRILEISDGRIIKDYINKHDDKIDYKMDNTIYLKDFKYIYKNKDNNINIDYYNDEDKKLDLVIVVKHGNIYIKSNTNNRIEVIDNTSSIEFINDHYKKLDKTIYEKYSFDYDNIINKDIKLRYSSIFNIITIIKHGFKKVFGYGIVKKLLLVGFFLSAMFMTYSVSNIMGLLTIRDIDFMSTDKNYLKIERNKILVDDYLKYENIDDVLYILPGNSIVNFVVKGNEYYQTKDSNIRIEGSISSRELINDNDIVLGRYPESDNEIVIDKMVYDRTSQLELIGYYEIERMIGAKVVLGKEYTIVGVVDNGSPSIYTNRGEINKIISNSYNNSYDYGYDVDINIDEIIDYYDNKDKLKIVKGREPSNDYEVIINEELQYDYKLNKEVDIVVNNKKLIVVGYYQTSDDNRGYYVNSNTKKYDLIENSKGIIIYPKDKDKVIENFMDMGIKLNNVYQSDKDKYMNERKDSVYASLIVASVMLGISLIEIILMTRSSFLSRIKEVGIYRAIGVKKLDIYKMFISESFAISTIVGLPGVLFMSYCLYTLKDIDYIGNNYLINIYIVLLCIILVYIFNMIVGLLPVFNTVRKTPARILSGKEVD